MTKLKDVEPRGDLLPFACTYSRNGRRFCITVWAKTWEEAETESEASKTLFGFQVDGRLLATSDASFGLERRIRREENLPIKSAAMSSETRAALGSW